MYRKVDLGQKVGYAMSFNEVLDFKLFMHKFSSMLNLANASQISKVPFTARATGATLLIFLEAF